MRLKGIIGTNIGIVYSATSTLQTLIAVFLDSHE